MCLSSITGDLDLRPESSIEESARRILTFLTRPSSLGYVRTTRASCHWFLGRFSSFTKTTSSSRIFRLGLTHFCLACRVCRYPIFHLTQNSFARYCTRRHLFLEYRSAHWKDPGGGRTTLDFRVSNWLGESGWRHSGEVRSSTVSGRQFAIASASVMKVTRDSSPNCEPWLLKRAVRTLRTVRIWRSYAPPRWLE